MKGRLRDLWDRFVIFIENWWVIALFIAGAIVFGGASTGNRDEYQGGMSDDMVQVGPNQYVSWDEYDDWVAHQELQEQLDAKRHPSDDAEAPSGDTVD